jgi:hypothetical protein
MRDEAIAQEEGGGMAMMSMSGGCIPGGFYKVAAAGVKLRGITNNQVLSGHVFVSVEAANTNNHPVVIGLYVDGKASPAAESILLQTMAPRTFRSTPATLPMARTRSRRNSFGSNRKLRL